MIHDLTLTDKYENTINAIIIIAGFVVLASRPGVGGHQITHPSTTSCGGTRRIFPTSKMAGERRTIAS
jgi:hypothetical protein